MVRGVIELFKKYMTVFVFLEIWELLSRIGILNPLFIPSFSDVVITIWNMFDSGNLTEHIIISSQRAIAGFLTAAAIGVPLGLILGGWFKNLEKAIEPLMEILSQINPFILFHIILLILGIGEATKVTIIAWTCIWPIMFSTISGIRNVNPILLKTGRAFGLGKLKLFYKVVIPAASPSIFQGLRISAGYSLFMLIAAEMMGCSSGLGWLVLVSQENYEIKKIFAAALVIAFLGLIFDIFIKTLQKRFVVEEIEDTLNSADY
jgi:NitT/TauT family transport system permease protein